MAIGQPCILKSDFNFYPIGSKYCQTTNGSLYVTGGEEKEK